MLSVFLQNLRGKKHFHIWKCYQFTVDNWLQLWKPNAHFENPQYFIKREIVGLIWRREKYWSGTDVTHLAQGDLKLGLWVLHACHILNKCLRSWISVVRSHCHHFGRVGCENGMAKDTQGHKLWLCYLKLKEGTSPNSGILEWANYKEQGRMWSGGDKSLFVLLVLSL